MKKLVALLISVMLICSTAYALEIDLSGLSLAELVELQKQITMAMWETEEWQEVEVPIGVYAIGEDIPAGHWTISAPDVVFTADITLVSKLDSTGKGYNWNDVIYSTNLTGSKSMMNSMYPGSYAETTDLELSEGLYLVIENATVIFTPYTGKPALGFK